MFRTLCFLLSCFLLSSAFAVYAAGGADLLSEIHAGNHSQVRKLLQGGADVNSADGDGTTALMHAAVESDATMVKLLIDAGAAVNAPNDAGSPALMYASTSLSKTQLIIAAGADANVKNKRGPMARLPCSSFWWPKELYRKAVSWLPWRRRATLKRFSICSASA